MLCTSVDSGYLDLKMHSNYLVWPIKKYLFNAINDL